MFKYWGENIGIHAHNNKSMAFTSNTEITGEIDISEDVYQTIFH